MDDPTNHEKDPVALQHLAAEDKAKRSGSFGAVAPTYRRYRPGPPQASVDWYLPERVEHVVDLGAGTGALTRLLVDRADLVSAIEPDDRMRAVLTEGLPSVEALKGRGEHLPLSDHCADAVLASSSWHWMAVEPTLREVRRVLKPSGFLGALWSGPDPEGTFVTQSRELISQNVSSGDGLSTLMSDSIRPTSALEIPPGLGFAQPECQTFTWLMALNADEIVGLLATFSWVINLADDDRQTLFSQARRLLKELLGVEGEVTIDVDFRCDAWRAGLEV
jgi:SAM-dependent methyltransferase